LSFTIQGYSKERLFEKGILQKEEKLNFNFVMGVGGAVPATPKSLIFLMENLPPHSHWSVMGIGRNEYPMITLGMILGSGGARVGLEDNIYLSKGVLAEGNADLVEKAVRLAKDLGREIASVSEAREMLSLERGKVGLEAGCGCRRNFTDFAVQDGNEGEVLIAKQLTTRRIPRGSHGGSQPVHQGKKIDMSESAM
jgi:hypothetical protein